MEGAGGAVAAMVRVLAVITAAGESSRMGSPKPLLRWGSRTFLEAMIGSLAEAGMSGPAAVVIGADPTGEISSEVVRLGAVPLENRSCGAGRFSSIRLAALWAQEEGARTASRGALLLWPADCPGVRPATLSALRAAAERSATSNISPVCDARGGHPIIVSAGTIRRILAAGSDANLRDILREDGARHIRISVDDEAVLDNLNTPEAYDAFLRDRTPPGTVGRTDA